MDHRAVTAMVAALAPVIHEHVVKGIAEGLKPLQERIAELEKRAPEKGEPGPAGKDGADGKDGAPGRDGEKGEPGPAGKAGGDGKDGAPGEAGAAGKNGADGKDGAPGRDGQPGVPGRDGKDGEKGADGRDGKDGLGFEDMSIEHDGERGIRFLFSRGDQVREFAVDLPIVIDRGVWREGGFKRGDGVSWGGSFFIAQRDTTEKPEASKDWRLAVKRGRDGKDGKPGDKGEPGAKGDRGEPGPRGYGG